ncbi:MAG: hypothetical protein RLZZ546_1620 [Bacteroidota bacterium]
MKIFKTIILIASMLSIYAFVSNSSGYKPGDIVTDFSLSNIDGKKVSLSSFKNVKGYIIIFTCNHCPYAVLYEDRIKALDEKYSKNGYPLIAINPNDPSIEPDDSLENMKLRAKEKGFKFPYLFDEGQKVFPQFGATKTPHAFLLDKNKVVKYIGAIDDNAQDANMVKVKFIEEAIKAIESGKEIIPNVTKAIGCGIKVKKVK